MPLPLIPVIAGGVVALGSAVGIPFFVKLGASKRVAILGGPQTGKSTLLHVLREGVMPFSVEPTPAPTPVGRFVTKVDQKPVGLQVPNDLPGRQSLGFQEWKRAFVGAQCVWYLFRADRIADGDAEEVRRVKAHLDLLKDWKRASRGKGPRVVLVGTWADVHGEYAASPAQFAADVWAAPPIKLGHVKLGNAPVIVGSLATHSDANALAAKLKNTL